MLSVGAALPWPPEGGIHRGSNVIVTHTWALWGSDGLCSGDSSGRAVSPLQYLTMMIAPHRRTGYAQSTGLLETKGAKANHATELGATTRPGEVIIPSGDSEAADLVLTTLVNPCGEVLLPVPGYPLYPAIINKLGADARYYNLDDPFGWQQSVDEGCSLLEAQDRSRSCTTQQLPAIVRERHFGPTFICYLLCDKQGARSTGVGWMDVC